MATILVIDDDKDILRLLEFTLKRAGHSVLIANNGEEGLAETRDKNPDLVVCDVMMPKMTGYEFCKQVRADEEIKDIPIIMFSARFQPVDKKTALEAGATDYLPKSTAPDALVSRITELLPTATQPAPARGVIGVFSLRGGAGVTSLAVNLSIALTLRHKTSVGLVDLALRGGHASVMMGLRPTSNVAHAIANITGNFNRNTLKPHFIQHSSGVQLLASAPTFIQELSPTDNSLFNLVSSFKNVFPLTILDVPHVLEPHFSPILQFIDKIILLLTTDMPSLQSTAIAIQGLTKLGLTDKNIILVTNQVTPYNTLPLATIQKALKRPILAEIPFDADMVKAVNSGKPLIMSNPRSATSAAIGRLSQAIFT